MYGAFIGDIIGSKYEFRNIKTKNFPLFSPGCDYTDDTVMTAAVAKAILLSRQERYNKGTQGKGFQEFLVETMQDFGRRYPNPAGAYGAGFSRWLRQQNPQPYGSYGNGSAMRVSPCGLAAVSIREAAALARASASVTHNHPDGVNGAVAVSVTIFLAKCGYPKSEIRKYINEHYYPLNFTLDSIRSGYKFDSSCQGSVPQAITAFLESENFEDAIRNAISIGGDSDTIGAITGSIAWIYYAGYSDWVCRKFTPSMEGIKNQAKAFLPQEFLDIEDEFLKACAGRGGVYYRSGYCTPILSDDEMKIFFAREEAPERPREDASSDRNSEAPSFTVTPKIRETMITFCRKYVLLMEALYLDKELNQWCRSYSAYKEPTQHCQLSEIIYNQFMKEAYAFDFMATIICARAGSKYTLESMLNGTEEDLLYGIFTEIRADYGCNGSLIHNSIAQGNLYRLMSAYLARVSIPRYTMEYILKLQNSPKENRPGACSVSHDTVMNYWRLTVQLDYDRLWYLSVFVHENGSFLKYSLDKEAACDSHYEFTEEDKIRDLLYAPGDEYKLFHDVLLRFLQKRKFEELKSQIMPYVTAQYHYY